MASKQPGCCWLGHPLEERWWAGSGRAAAAALPGLRAASKKPSNLKEPGKGGSLAWAGRGFPECVSSRADRLGRLTHSENVLRAMELLLLGEPKLDLWKSYTVEAETVNTLRKENHDFFVLTPGPAILVSSSYWTNNVLLLNKRYLKLLNEPFSRTPPVTKVILKWCRWLPGSRSPATPGSAAKFLLGKWSTPGLTPL